MFDIIFICDDEVAEANMLWPWLIYVLESDIAWFYDLTVLIHDNIIDRLMTWIIMAEGIAH